MMVKNWIPRKSNTEEVREVKRKVIEIEGWMEKALQDEANLKELVIELDVMIQAEYGDKSEYYQHGWGVIEVGS